MPTPLVYLAYLLALLSVVGGLRLVGPLWAERVRPATTRGFRARWIPSEFTPAGQRLRRRITAFLVMALVFLALGVWL